MKTEMVYPEGLQEHGARGITVKKVGGTYYLYKRTSKRVPRKKYPQPVDTYAGIITSGGVIQSKKKDPNYAEILTYVVVGHLAGRLSLRRCLAWCSHHLNWLKNYLELKNGIAFAATVSRLPSSIHEKMFCLAFIE